MRYKVGDIVVETNNRFNPYKVRIVGIQQVNSETVIYQVNNLVGKEYINPYIEASLLEEITVSLRELREKKLNKLKSL